MRWSVTIGRVFGITLRLHVTFLLLLAFIGYAGFAEAGVAGAIWALSLFCSIFACIVLHELGHSVVAQLLGVEVKSITLLPIGGVAALRGIPENPWHEIAITLAGPMVNAAIALVLLPFTGLPSHLFYLSMPQSVGGLLDGLVKANLVLFVFNFIPAFPMDGGRLFRAVLALAISYRRATIVAATVGQGLAILFVLIGLTHVDLWLWTLVGVFIFIGADGEEKMVRARSLLRELDVEDVMAHEFAVLSPADTVARGLEMVYQTGQDDFPVVDGDQLLGVVTRPAMLEAMNKIGADAPVAEVMETNVPPVSPRANLSQVYETMLTEGHASLPVMRDGRLAGWLGLDNISRCLLVKSSIKTQSRAPARQGAVAHTPAPPPVISAVPPIATPPPHGGPYPPPGPA